MGCSTSTVKLFTLIFIILCFIFAAVIISVNIYSLMTFSGDVAASSVVQRPCIVALILGSLLLAISLLGFYGTLKGSIRLASTYSITLLLILLAQVAVIFLMPFDFKRLAAVIVEAAWNQDFQRPGTMAIYEIQYNCCGKTGSDDYYQNGQDIPNSCYQHQNYTENLYTVGCVRALTDVFAGGSRVEELSDWLLVGVETMSLVCTAFLIINLDHKKRRERF